MILLIFIELLNQMNSQIFRQPSNLLIMDRQKEKTLQIDMNIIIRLILLFILFLSSQSGIATTTKFITHQYDMNNIVLSEELFGYNTNSSLLNKVIRLKVKLN